MHIGKAISVIVPVYRDWDSLATCLKHLSRQTLPADQFEIIVVDNDIEGKALDDRPPGIRYLHHPLGFSYAARNAGLAIATGVNIAFTDSDCRPEPNWLSSGLAVLNSGEADLVAGRISLFSRNDNLSAFYDRAFAFKQEQYVKNNTAATANLFVRRRVIDTLGGFDSARESGGDFDFCRRAVSSGFRLIYCNDAVVGHPTRDNLSELFKKNRRVARGAWSNHLRGHGGKSLHLQVRPLLSYFVPFPRKWSQEISSGLSDRDTPRDIPVALRYRLLALRHWMHWSKAVLVLFSAVKYFAFGESTPEKKT